MKQQVGDSYVYPKDRGRICASAFHIMYPLILALQLNGTHSSFGDGGNSTTVGCSDYRHQVVYKITREEVE